MTHDELRRLIEKAEAAYNSLSPSGKLRHRYEQRRSFAKGMCPSSRDYAEFAAKIDESLPPAHMLTDTEIGLVLVGEKVFRSDAQPDAITKEYIETTAKSDDEWRKLYADLHVQCQELQEKLIKAESERDAATREFKQAILYLRALQNPGGTYGHQKEATRQVIDAFLKQYEAIT